MSFKRAVQQVAGVRARERGENACSPITIRSGESHLGLVARVSAPPLGRLFEQACESVLHFRGTISRNMPSGSKEYFYGQAAK